MSFNERLNAATFVDCLRSVRVLSDEEIVSEFHKLFRLRNSDSGLRAILVYHFFLGYRASLPYKLQWLALKFDTAAELAVVMHLLILAVAPLAFLIGGLRAWGIAASGMSVVLLLILRRLFVIEALVARWRAIATGSMDHSWEGRRVLSQRYVPFRQAYSAAAYFAHDLVIAIAVVVYVSLATATTIWTGTTLSGFALSLGWLLPFCLIVRLFLQNAAPPFLLVLGASEDTMDSTIYLYRQCCYPCRVSNLLALKRARSRGRISPKSEFLRVHPYWYARLIWPAVVWLEMHAASLIIIHQADSKTDALQRELQMLDSASIPYTSVGGERSNVYPSMFFAELERRSWLVNFFPSAHKVGNYADNPDKTLADFNSLIETFKKFKIND